MNRLSARQLVIILMLLNVIPLLPQRSKAQWKSIGDVARVEKIDRGVLLDAAPAKVQVTALTPEIIRVRMSRTGTFGPDSSWAVVGKPGGAEPVAISDGADSVTMSTSALSLHVRKSPCRLLFYDAAGNLINADEPSKGMGWAGTEVAVWKTMPEEEYYFGFGEKAGSLNRKWKSMCNWNSDIPGYHGDTDPLYETVPFFYGMQNGRTYGIFFDNTYYSFFNMGKENPEQYSFGAVDGELNYYFIYGPSPREVVQRFSSLIGTMPLPPKWAVGYQQCRYSYFPESRVREIARNFRTKQIPCDVIYLDIHYMNGYRCFTWDSTRFPNPKKMASDLGGDGFKMVVIIDPGIKAEKGYFAYDEGVEKDEFVKYPDGKLYIGKVWPGDCAFPDFTKKSAREWWGTLYKGLVGTGIKGFWNDMNEPAVFIYRRKTMPPEVVHDDNGLKTDHRKNHNIYGMQMARGTYEGNLRLRPTDRPFVLTRANYAGGQRYAAAWTGDNISSWEHLELAVPMCLNLSISGQPFVGTDIGGFIGAPTGELYARWLQLGIFTPLMRTHTVFGSPDQEPWSYGPEFESVNKKSIELRYRLLPYMYTQFYVASTSGVPMMRPLVFDYPEDDETLLNNRDFLFGDAFLVAPVLRPGDTTRTVYLPKGVWYDYWTGKKYSGPDHVTVDAPVDRVPLFAKAGAVIPTQQVVQYSDEAPIDPLTLEVYPARSGSATYYEDDGKSFDYRKGKYFLRSITVDSTASGTVIVLSEPEGTWRPPDRSLVLKLNGVTRKPSRVRVDGRTVSPSAGTYDEASKVFRLRLKDRFASQKIIIG